MTSRKHVWDGVILAEILRAMFCGLIFGVLLVHAFGLL